MKLGNVNQVNNPTQPTSDNESIVILFLTQIQISEFQITQLTLAHYIISLHTKYNFPN